MSLFLFFPFHFLFLSFSHSCIFSLFFFLPCFCCSFFALFLGFLFHDQNNIKNMPFERLIFINHFCFWVSCFVIQIPFSCACLFFLILSCAFGQHQCFLSFKKKKTTSKTPMFGEVPGCNQMFLFITCGLQNVKS